MRGGSRERKLAYSGSHLYERGSCLRPVCMGLAPEDLRTGAKISEETDLYEVEVVA